MTRKEIEAARKRLPRMCEVPWSQWSKVQQRKYNELDCREMINSCLCYGGIASFWEKFTSYPEGLHSYADMYVAKLGEERVKELVEEQEMDFSKATVLRNVFEDDEGVSYHSIHWIDE